LIAIPYGDGNYALLQQLNPTWFTQLGTMEEAGWTVVGVSSPQPTAAECEAAKSASR
jgi:hypothetical protein